VRQMKIATDRLIMLGQGKFIRADAIQFLEPVEGVERGPGKRTQVWYDRGAIFAGRTEQSIVRDMTADDSLPETYQSEDALWAYAETILENVKLIGPGMRGMIKETGWDLDALEEDIRGFFSKDETGGELDSRI
jgi:hypothetical protein